MCSAMPRMAVGCSARGAGQDRARERRLMGPLRETLTTTDGRPVEVTVVVDSGLGVR